MQYELLQHNIVKASPSSSLSGLQLLEALSPKFAFEDRNIKGNESLFCLITIQCIHEMQKHNTFESNKDTFLLDA